MSLEFVTPLYRADAGSVHFDGRLVSDPSDTEAQRAFRQDIQMIFQDPFSSLNPRMRVDTIIAEPIHHHRLLRGRAVRDRVRALCERFPVYPDAE